MRKSVRAIIIQNNKLLVIERKFPDDLYWVLPGGGIEKSDVDEKSAIQRECKEEAGVEIIVGKKIWNRKFKGNPEKYFLCTIIGGQVQKGNGPEYQDNNNDYYGTHKPKWLPLDKLKNYNLLPHEIKDIINQNSRISEISERS